MSLFRQRKRARVPEAVIITEIDSTARPQIERRRLLRMFAAISREANAAEIERLRSLMKTCHPNIGPQNLFIGMHAVTLTHENKDLLDEDGFASLKADGIHCHLARVNLMAKPLTEGQPEPPAPADRADSAFFITRDHRVRAVDRVILHADNKRLLLDGELCLRKIQLSEDERLRVNSAFNVHQSGYLDYYSYADEQAVAEGIDIMSDEHQRQYDHFYEIVYAAFDCMLINSRQMNRDYLQRITLIHDMTETQMTQTTTAAYRRRLDQIKRAVEYAGGAEQVQLTVFLKPTWSVKDIRAAMHAVPACMQGIATDGVIFNPNVSSYVVGTNPKLLKFKLHHTADLAFVYQPSGQLDLMCTTTGGALTKILPQVLIDTETAKRLSQLRASPLILECEAVIVAPESGAAATVTDLWWRPLQHRVEKRAPNLFENYQAVVRAVLNPFDEEAVVEFVRKKLNK